MHATNRLSAYNCKLWTMPIYLSFFLVIPLCFYLLRFTLSSLISNRATLLKKKLKMVTEHQPIQISDSVCVYIPCPDFVSPPFYECCCLSFSSIWSYHQHFCVACFFFTRWSAMHPTHTHTHIHTRHGECDRTGSWKQVKIVTTGKIEYHFSCFIHLFTKKKTH